MNESLIAAGATLLVCLINNHYQQKQSDKKHDETISLIDYKLEQLTKKVDLHNNAVERLYEVEKRLGIDEERIKVANHRIEKLRQVIKNRCKLNLKPHRA